MRHLPHLRPGQRFGRLVLVEDLGRHGRDRKWACVCDCGNASNVFAGNLRRANTKSCGCLQKEIAAAHKFRHGHAKSGAHSTEYNIYQSMMDRCYRPSSASYSFYGARGIVVCGPWRDGDGISNTGFQVFLSDMGRRPSKNHSLDRVDTNGGYSPDNCRWATAKEQARNRRTNRFVDLPDGPITIAEAAEITGLHRSTITARIHRGLSAEQVMAT